MSIAKYYFSQILINLKDVYIDTIDIAKSAPLYTNTVSGDRPVLLYFFYRNCIKPVRC